MARPSTVTETAEGVTVPLTGGSAPLNPHVPLWIRQGVEKKCKCKNLKKLNRPKFGANKLKGSKTISSEGFGR